MLSLNQTYGAYIDRSRSEQVELRRKHDMKGMQTYLRGLPDEDGYHSFNASFLLKVTTPLRLNLLSPDGEKMIDESDNGKEVHFMQVECELDRVGIYNASAVYNFYRLMLYFFKMFVGNPWARFEDEPKWVITDFDNHLKGNP